MPIDDRLRDKTIATIPVANVAPRLTDGLIANTPDPTMPAGAGPGRPDFVAAVFAQQGVTQGGGAVVPGVVVANNGFGAIGNSWIGNGSAQQGNDANARPLKPGDAAFSGSTAQRSLPEQLSRYLGQQAWSSVTLAYGLTGDTVGASNTGPGALARLPAAIAAAQAAGCGWMLGHICGNEVGAIRTAGGAAYTVATTMTDVDAYIAQVRAAGLVCAISNVTPHGYTGQTGQGEFTGAQLTLYQGIRAGINARHNPAAGVYVFDNIGMVPGLCTDTTAMTYGPGFSPDALHVHGFGMAKIAQTFATWVKAQGFLKTAPSGVTVPSLTAIAGALSTNPNMTDADANNIPDGYSLSAIPAGLTIAGQGTIPDPDNAALNVFFMDIVGTPTGTANTMVTYNWLFKTTNNPASNVGDKWSMLAKLRADAINGATDAGLAGMGIHLRHDFTQGTTTDYLPVAGQPKVDTAPTTQLLDRIPLGQSVVALTDPLMPLPSDYVALVSLLERVTTYFFVGVPVNVRLMVRGIDTRPNRNLAA